MIWCTSKVVTARNRNSSSWNKVLAEGGLYAGRTLTEASLLDSAAALAPTEVKNSLNSFARSVKLNYLSWTCIYSHNNHPNPDVLESFFSKPLLRRVLKQVPQ